MASPIITIDSNSPSPEAADMMLQYNIRHLLVVHNATDDSDSPIGILTPRDFTRYQDYANDNEKDSIEKILEYYI